MEDVLKPPPGSLLLIFLGGDFGAILNVFGVGFHVVFCIILSVINI